MVRARTAVASLVVPVASLLASVAAAAPREAGTPSAASVPRAASASPPPIKIWDDAAIREEIGRLAKSDAAAAKAACRKLLLTGRPDQRPLAVAALLSFADAKSVASIARELRPSEYRDERRLLVRALGRADAGEALPLLEGFAGDADALVRAAAASALADHGRPLAVGLFVTRLPSMSDYWDVGGTGDDHIFGCGVYGAIRALTGQTPANNMAVRQWWDANRAALTPATSRPATATPASVDRPVNGRLVTEAFDIRFQPLGLDQVVAQRFRLTGAGGWTPLVRDLESMAADARRRAAPLFGGTLHLPLTRIDFANAQTFGGTGGVAGRAGSAMRCRITFNLDAIGDLEQWRRLVDHEYVHIIHAAQFARTPRWLAEGLATSLSESPDRPTWSLARAQAQGMGPLIERGTLVSTAISWDTDGVTGAAENQKYALGHLLVDYLRFGPIGERDVRLFCLMGELDRGRPAQGAIERVYGLPLAQFERGLTTWLAQNK